MGSLVVLEYFILVHTRLRDYQMVAREGMTDFGEIGYGGPAPPDKRHTYVFKLYALDTELDSERRLSTKARIENAMKGHIIAEAN